MKNLTANLFIVGENNNNNGFKISIIVDDLIKHHKDKCDLFGVNCAIDEDSLNNHDEIIENTLKRIEVFITTKNEKSIADEKYVLFYNFHLMSKDLQTIVCNFISEHDKEITFVVISENDFLPEIYFDSFNVLYFEHNYEFEVKVLNSFKDDTKILKHDKKLEPKKKVARIIVSGNNSNKDGFPVISMKVSELVSIIPLNVKNSYFLNPDNTNGDNFKELEILSQLREYIKTKEKVNKIVVIKDFHIFSKYFHVGITSMLELHNNVSFVFIVDSIDKVDSQIQLWCEHLEYNETNQFHDTFLKLFGMNKVKIESEKQGLRLFLINESNNFTNQMNIAKSKIVDKFYTNFYDTIYIDFGEKYDINDLSNFIKEGKRTKKCFILENGHLIKNEIHRNILMNMVNQNLDLDFVFISKVDNWNVRPDNQTSTVILFNEENDTEQNFLTLEKLLNN